MVSGACTIPARPDGLGDPAVPDPGLLSPGALEAEARRRLPPAVFDYFAGGADDEATLAENEAAFRRLGLVPRVLRGAGPPELATELLGELVSMPVLVAPTAFHRLAHPGGERATARGARAAGTVMILSMAATEPVEAVAQAAGGRLWFQLYVQPDLGFTEAVVRRVEAAGCSALVVTVDSPVFGQRGRDLRHGFHALPEGLVCENMREPRADGMPGPVWNIVFSTASSWREIEWLRARTALKIVLKGIMHPDDARQAIDCGVDGLMVSNHGGRQLDTVPASLDLLPAVADAAAGRLPLLLDGGIRRGTDVVKALASGADAVAIGRPVLWALTLGGANGVGQVLDTLKDELARALSLCGCRTPRDPERGLLRRTRMGA